jgi:hypothetical protein
VIIVDSSVWIDHIRSPEPEMIAALVAGQVLQHPLVTGEIALGSIRNRTDVVDMLAGLPQAEFVRNAPLLDYIESAELHGTGVGLVDAHLLASAVEGSGIRIWTRDKRLNAQAERLGLNYVA